jgi:twitching motility protein PilT
MLEAWVQLGREQHASDVHIEPGLPLGLRVRGELRMQGEPIAASATMHAAKKLVGERHWPDFVERRSADVSRTIAGVRCRINVFFTSRGIGFAVRLLSSFQATLKKLNLHPELARLIQPTHGLVIISGPTGSGKSSTLAALIQEINLSETRHIVTVESPVEYQLQPKRAFIRQREVGRDTPSFERALLDAMREDPDVLMIGEMRDAETMRLTLNAAETGHLVLATMHSSNAAEACARIVAAFAPEAQAGICAQLADALVAVVCQRLTFRAAPDRMIPELEILQASTAARAVIRQGHFAKLQTVLESGAQEGQWSFARYRDWLSKRTDFFIPTAAENDLAADEAPPPEAPPPRPPAARAQAMDGVIEIPDDDDPAAILRELSRK